jgi:hypothetical protein
MVLTVCTEQLLQFFLPRSAVSIILSDSELAEARAQLDHFCFTNSKHQETLKEVLKRYGTLIESYKRPKSDNEEARENRRSGTSNWRGNKNATLSFWSWWMATDTPSTTILSAMEPREAKGPLICCTSRSWRVCARVVLGTAVPWSAFTRILSVCPRF